MTMHHKGNLLLGTMLGIVLVGSGCVTTPTTRTPSHSTPTNVVTPTGIMHIDLSLDQLALTLLGETDTVDLLTNARPQIIEFNEQYLARQWYDETTGAVVFEQAITKYATAVEARLDVQQYDGEHTALSKEVTLGDTDTMYREDDGITYRFSVGPYGVRVTLLDTTVTEKTTQLAVAQYNKIVELIYQDTITIPATASLEQLPITVPGGTLLGTAPVTGLEWFGTIRKFDTDTLAGYVSGAERRWRITSRPDEVLEIAIIEVETDQQAKDLAAGLIGNNTDELTLPDSIADRADAVAYDTLIELQSANGKFFIDISLYSPFGEIDLDAAKTDFVNISEAVLN